MEVRGIDGRIIIKWILEKWDGREAVDWVDFTQDKGRVAASCEDGDEPSCSIKCGEFLEYMRIC